MTEPIDPAAGPGGESRPLLVTALEAVLPGAWAAAFQLTGAEAPAAALVQDVARLAAQTPEAGSKPDFALCFLMEMVRIYRRDYAGPRPPSPIDLDDTPDLYLYARSIQHGLPWSGPDPAAALLDALGPDRITRAVAWLPEDYRLPCILSLTHSLSYQELGRVLDCPAGAVRTRLHRGRKMLQKALWHVAQEDGVVASLGGRPA